MTETSILLGAGFSVNKGYPTANQLNKKLIQLDAEDFFIYTDGTVFLKEKNIEDPCWYSTDFKHKYFVVKLIEYYIKQKETFNYEKFYDFYNEFYRGKEDEDFNIFCEEFRNEYNIKTNNLNLLSQTNKIFNQLISLFLVDSEGKKFYDSIHYCKPTYDGYSGFLNCIETWGNEGITHIHTLNHDIFFETLKSTDWIQGKLSDGFEESGSKFYGSLKDNYKVRLPYFTNNFTEQFRLYKLHGSFDQFPFHIQDTGIDTYVKIKLGIGTTELYKEVEDDKGGYEYINDWMNYHPDFLSGTTSKILRYREPWYYEKVFNNFEKNLVNSNKLVLIGYGCGDSEINNIIEQNFDYKNYPMFVVDPYPSQQIKEFVQKFNAKLIEKTPDNLKKEDFE